MATTPQSMLFYCLRAQRQFAAFSLFDGRQIPVDFSGLSNAKEWSERYFQPYGVAVDASNQQFWFANKFSDSLWNITLSLTDAIRMTPRRVLDYPRQLPAPCGIDVFNDDILISCFGYEDFPAGVFYLQNNHSLRRLTPVPTHDDTFSHCLFLPDGQVAYVSRWNMVLWTNDREGRNPRTVTRDRTPAVPGHEGKLSELSLQYVQGISWSYSRNCILIADANLGCIFEVRIEEDYYRIIAGTPALSDSSWIANLEAGSARRWLGAIRGVKELPTGEVAFLDGQTGYPWIVSKNQDLTPFCSKPLFPPQTIIGTGLTLVHF